MGSKSFQHDTAVLVGHYSAPLALSLANIAVYYCTAVVVMLLDRKFPAERLPSAVAVMYSSSYRGQYTNSQSSRHAMRWCIDRGGRQLVQVTVSQQSVAV